MRYASFQSIREVYKIENEKLRKFGVGLSIKALWSFVYLGVNMSN